MNRTIELLYGRILQLQRCDADTHIIDEQYTAVLALCNSDGPEERNSFSRKIPSSNVRLLKGVRPHHSPALAQLI
jgi:hypothetical protein